MMAKTLYRLGGILLVCWGCASHTSNETVLPPETGPELLDEVQSDFYSGDENPSVRDDNAHIDTRGAVVGLDASARKLHWKYWKFWTSPKHKWVAVINSNAPYPRMGLGKGNNYIFKLADANPNDTEHSLVVVPEDGSIKPHYLTYRAADPLVPGNPHKPVVIRKKVSTMRADAFVIGGCIECDPAGHCSTMDSGAAYQ